MVTKEIRLPKQNTGIKKEAFTTLYSFKQHEFFKDLQKVFCVPSVSSASPMVSCAISKALNKRYEMY